MAQFETAQRHLTQALRRLEAALESRVSGPPGGSVGGGADAGALARISAERDALRARCEQLSAALSEAQHDNRSLREVSGHVAQRLDGSIVELDRLLGS